MFTCYFFVHHFKGIVPKLTFEIPIDTYRLGQINRIIEHPFDRFLERAYFVFVGAPGDVRALADQAGDFQCLDAALGGRVFDILGEVFEDRSLKDLLIEAIRYGSDPEVRARLERVDECFRRSRIERG